MDSAGRASSGAAARQRRAARAILGFFVVVAIGIFGLPGSPLGFMSSAQQQSPTPTGTPTTTARPTATATASPGPTGPQIQFVNPSLHSFIVSGKNDGTDTTYHLVAWVSEVPNNPLVEFKFQASGSNEFSIGTAQRVGTTDTWELNWNLADVEDGDYVLKAILYNNDVEISRDEEDIVVNQDDDPLDPQAETVNITYPVNAGLFGMFQPAPNVFPLGVVDVTVSGANPQPSASQGTNHVRAFYTVSAPGTEPQWKTCGTETRAASADGVRCSLQSGDAVTAVTAIAAVANDAPPQGGFQAPFTDSGDAHRVSPYVQAPTSIALTPSSQNRGTGACSEPITATVLDQNRRKVAAVNTDIHARGPTDNLLFDDSGDQSSAHKVPDKAHGSTELAWNCEGSGLNGSQAQHEVVAAEPDIKHIESTTGTTDAGTFFFKLYSPDAGNTDVAAFADTDDDDLWCSAEGSGEGTISWSTTAPTTGPSPTPTPTPSPSPTGSPTGSPSPSPPANGTGGLSPETTNCPQGPGDGPNREITLDVSDNRVPAGERVTFSGEIISEEAGCRDDEVVEIRRRVHGTFSFENFATTATEPDGTYEVTARVDESANYQAVAPAHDTCDETSSEAVTVRVRVVISIRVNDRTPEAGSTVVFRGRVTPNHEGSRVVLQRKRGDRWVKVEIDELNRRSRYRIAIDPGVKTRVYRVRWRSVDDDHESGRSKKVKVNPHA